MSSSSFRLEAFFNQFINHFEATKTVFFKQAESGMKEREWDGGREKRVERYRRLVKERGSTV